MLVRVQRRAQSRTLHRWPRASPVHWARAVEAFRSRSRNIRLEGPSQWSRFSRQPRPAEVRNPGKRVRLAPAPPSQGRSRRLGPATRRKTSEYQPSLRWARSRGPDRALLSSRSRMPDSETRGASPGIYPSAYLCAAVLTERIRLPPAPLHQQTEKARVRYVPM